MTLLHTSIHQSSPFIRLRASHISGPWTPLSCDRLRPLLPRTLMERIAVSPAELKKDLSAALELNDSCCSALRHDHCSSGKVSDRHIHMVCETRARLTQALEKATQFFESNVELLATIASLKRESAQRKEEYEEKERIMQNRISCLLDIVREQQESLENKQQTLALKGIWANLIGLSRQTGAEHCHQVKKCAEKNNKSHQISKDTVDSTLDDVSSNVITWISLQCAKEARNGTNGVHRYPKDNFSRHWIREYKEEEGRIDSTLQGTCTINELVSKFRELFHAADTKWTKMDTENSKMRVRLNEMSAAIKAMHQDLQSKCEEVDRLEIASRALKSDYECIEQQLKKKNEENDKLKIDYEKASDSCQSWRKKCHEILDAMEKNVEVKAKYHSEVSRSSHSKLTTDDVDPSGTRCSSLSSQQSPVQFYQYETYQNNRCLVQDEYLEISPATPYVDTTTISKQCQASQTTEAAQKVNSQEMINKRNKTHVVPVNPMTLDDATLYRILMESEDACPVSSEKIDEEKPSPAPVPSQSLQTPQPTHRLHTSKNKHLSASKAPANVTWNSFFTKPQVDKASISPYDYILGHCKGRGSSSSGGSTAVKTPAHPISPIPISQ